MPPLSSCFTVPSATKSSSASTAPNISTSIYETRLGFASFTWSRTLLGPSLNASVHFTDSNFNTDSSPFHFKIRPYLLFKRKGTRRFNFNIGNQIRTIHIAWNLARARFPSVGSPEPSSGFFIAASVDGEVFLVAGDMSDEAHKKLKAKQKSHTLLVSRSEDVVMKGKGKDRRRMGAYRSAVRIGGADREIGVEIDGVMEVTVGGRRILYVRRIRWNFRGSERVEIDDGGGTMLISWDLHPWFFSGKENCSSGCAAAAIFVFCFEGEKEREISCENVMRMGNLDRDFVWRNLGRGNWSEGSKKRLLKTCSSSSSFSSAASSSAASSSVVEWWSSEEAAMRGVDGFTLVVYAWKG